MSEEQLTVEKLQSFVNYCDSMSHVEYVMADAPPEHNDVMSCSHMELHKFLLFQLATIERDTAEKCYKLATRNGSVVTRDDIRDHFNLGEKP